MNPEVNRNSGESAGYNSEQETHFPSFEEHMKQVKNPVENDSDAPSQAKYEHLFRNILPEDRPEGVRDAQDLKEYTEEREAKQAESIEKQKSAILENYNVSDDKVEALTSSKEFAAFCRSGITIDELIKKNIVIARKEDYYLPTPGSNHKILDHQRESSFDDMCEMVEDLGSFYICKENHEELHDTSDGAQFPVIKNYIDKLDNPTSITKEDTMSIVLSIYPNSGIARRLLFGNPNNISTDNAVKRTSMTLEHVRDYKIDDSILDKESTVEFLDLADKIIEKGLYPRGGELADERIKPILRPKLREAIRAHTEDFAISLRADIEQGGYDGGYTDYNGLKDLVLKSTSLLSICRNHDILTKAGISEEELLDSVYGFDNKKFSEYKSRPEAYPDHHIARDANTLIESGFSKDSIVDAIHDNDIYIDEYEIERMREAGIDDVDVAYAKRVCNYAYLFEDKIKIGMEEIKVDGARFSRDAILGAAIKEIQYRNHQNYPRSRQKNGE